MYCKHCIYESLVLQQKKIKEEKKRLKFIESREEEDRQLKEYESEKKRISVFEKMEHGIKKVGDDEDNKPKEKMNAYWVVCRDQNLIFSWFEWQHILPSHDFINITVMISCLKPICVSWMNNIHLF